jgi:hypothetical protein
VQLMPTAWEMCRCFRIVWALGISLMVGSEQFAYGRMIKRCCMLEGAISDAPKQGDNPQPPTPCTCSHLPALQQCRQDDEWGACLCKAHLKAIAMLVTGVDGCLLARIKPAGCSLPKQASTRHCSNFRIAFTKRCNRSSKPMSGLTRWTTEVMQGCNSKSKGKSDNGKSDNTFRNASGFGADCQQLQHVATLERGVAPECHAGVNTSWL